MKPLEAANRTCERILDLGPWGLAGLMLLGILLLPTPPAMGHGGGAVDPIESDNLLRWGIGNGMTLWAFHDDKTLCPKATCGLYFEWVNPPSRTPFFCGGCEAGQDNAVALDNRLKNLIGLGTGLSGTTNAALMPIAKLIPTTTNHTANQTIFNATFPANVTATNLSFKLIANINPSDGGTVTFWYSFWDASNVSVREVLGETIDCDGTHSGVRTNFSFPSTTFRSFRINASLTGACAVANAYYDHLQIYSRGNVTEAARLSENALEFADWLAHRCLTTSGVCGTADLVTGPGAGYSRYNLSANAPANFTVIVEANSTSFLYTGQGCNTSGGFTQCGTPFYPWPQPYGPGDSGSQDACLSYTFMGGSTGTNRNQVPVWNITNTCSNAKVVRMGGAICTGSDCAVKHFNQFKAYPHTKTGTNLTSYSTTPKTATLYDYLGTPQSIALVYQDRDGPFLTLPPNYAIQFADHTQVERQLFAGNVRTVGSQAFTVTLNPREFYGNAVYFVLGTNETGRFCDDSDAGIGTLPAIINGVSVTPAQRFIHRLDAGTLSDWCFWLLEDFSNTYNAPTTNGNLEYQDNTPSQQVYTVEIRDWTATSSALNGGIGALLYNLANVSGNGSLYFQCNRVQSTCFGNHNTLGLPSAAGTGISTTWNWHTRDYGSQVDVADAFIVETLDTNPLVAGSTNATGRLTLTTTTNDANWTVSKNGYNTAYINLSFLAIYAQANVTVNLTNDPSRPYYRTTCEPYVIGPGTAGYNCTVNPDATRSDTCTTIQNTTTCASALALAQNWNWACPNDATSGVLGVIPRVNVSSLSHTLGGISNDRDSCPGYLEFRNLPRNDTYTWLLSKEGYRGLQIDLRADAQTVYVNTVMRQGTGTFRPNVTYVNASFVSTLDNVTRVTNITTIYLTDNGTTASAFTITPAVTIPQEGVPSVEAMVVGLGDGIGLASTAGRVLWGLILLVVFVLLFVVLWVKFAGQPPGAGTVSLMVVPAFFAIGFLGLWPSWLIIVVILAFIALGFAALRGFLPGGG